MAWKIDNINFFDYGVIVEKSEGVLDLPNIIDTSYDWLDLDGRDFWQAQPDVKYNDREIILKCWIMAASYADFKLKVNNFFTALVDVGTVPSLSTPYGSDINVNLLEQVNVVRKSQYNSDVQAGQFTLKLTVYGDLQLKLITVYTAAGVVRAYTYYGSDAKITRAMQGNSEISFAAEFPVVQQLTRGDYVMYENEKYISLEDPQIDKFSTNKFSYKLTFVNQFFVLKDVLFRSIEQSEFYWWANLNDIIDKAIENTNRSYTGLFVKGTIDATESRNHQFSNENCYDVISRIAGDYELEFEYSWDQTLGKIQINVKSTIDKPTGIILEYGKNKGLYKISRTSTARDLLVTRLFAYGSEKNIPANYGFSRLKLASEPVTVASSDSIEKTKVWEDIFPHRTGTVASYTLDITDPANPTYAITDSSMFDLNAKDIDGNSIYLNGSTPAKVHFNTGQLAGFEFEVNKFVFNDAAGVGGTMYLTAIKEYPDTTYPHPAGDPVGSAQMEPRAQIGVIGDANYYPADEHVLLDINLPQSYIDAAEAELLAAANAHITEFSKPKDTYTVETDPSFITGVLNPGNTVTLSDPDLVVLESRISSIVTNMYTNGRTITLSSYLKKPRLASMSEMSAKLERKFITEQRAARANDYLMQVTANAYADGIVTESELLLIASAQAKADLAAEYATAYADGIVTEAEWLAIDNAITKVELAEAAAALDATVKVAVTQENVDNYITSNNLTVSDLQNQVDGQVISWFENYTPSLTVYPTTDWTTDTEKSRHIGDTFTNTQAFVDEATTPNAGKSWRFVYVNSVYSWTSIADSDAVKALLKAAEAQDTADNKRRVFVVIPTPPYDIGDLWLQGSGASDEFMRCHTVKAAGTSYAAADWILSTKYTDDTTATTAIDDAAAALAEAQSKLLIGAAASDINTNVTTVDGGKITTNTIVSLGKVTSFNGLHLADPSLVATNPADPYVFGATYVGTPDFPLLYVGRRRTTTPSATTESGFVVERTTDGKYRFHIGNDLAYINYDGANLSVIGANINGYLPTGTITTSVGYLPKWSGTVFNDSLISQTTGAININGDLNVTGNITATKEVTAWVAGAVTSDVLAGLTGIAPLYKPTSSTVGIRLDASQFQLNASNELQIKDGVVQPAGSYVLTSTTVAGKALSSNITLAINDLSDVVSTSPNADDILTFDGLYWTPKTGVIGAGNGIIEYLTSTDSPDVTDAKYLYLARTPVTSVETSFSASVSSATSPVEIKRFIMSSTGIGVTAIPAGIWQFNTWANNSFNATSGFEILVYAATVSGGVVTLGSPLFTVPNQLLTNIKTGYEIDIVQQAFTGLTANHRLVFLYRATQSISASRTVTIYVGGSAHTTHVHTPLQTRHNDLAGLNVGDYKHLTASQLIVVQNTSGTNSGNNAANTNYANDYRAANFIAGTDYEPAFPKNTGFNKNYGSVAGTVLQGRTFGTAANSATGDFIQNQNASAQSANMWISGEGNFRNTKINSANSYAFAADGFGWIGYPQETNGMSIAMSSITRSGGPYKMSISSEYGFSFTNTLGTNVFLDIATNGNVDIGYGGTRTETFAVNGSAFFNGSIVAGSEITAYSDKRLKDNIQPLTVRGDLNPVTYIKDGKKSIGFIAQEVRKIYPELVKGDEAKEMLSLNYQQLTAVLYAELIEMKRQIKELKGGIK